MSECALWTSEVCVNQYIDAKKTFTIKSIVPATLRICADTQYTVYVNGEFVGTGQYQTFDNRHVYDSYDVTPFLREGENELAVTAYHQGIDTQTGIDKKALLWFRLDCGETTVLSDEDTLVRPAAGYRSGTIEQITSQLGFSYHYNAADTEAPWQRPCVFTLTVPEARPIGKLLLSFCEGGLLTQGKLLRSVTNGTPAELMQKDFLSFRERKEILDAGTIKKDADGVYLVFDLGIETAGYLSMDLTAGEGTVLDIGYGEHLDDLRVRTNIGGRNFACRYICKNGLQNFSGYFRRFACRYIAVHITNMTGDLSIRRLGLIKAEYPLDRIGSFSSGNTFYDTLYDVSVRTMRLCMHEHYEDCPWREQALYAFDSYVQMLCGYYAFGEYDFPRASLRLLADGQHEDGLLELCAPCRMSITIPSFSLAYILSLENYVLFSGDTAFGREMLPVAEKILAAFDRSDGIIRLNTGAWNFYEWTTGLDGANKSYETDAAINFYYILAVNAYNRLCGYVDSENRLDIGDMTDRVCETFYDAGRGLYRTHTDSDTFHELTQSLAVLCGAAHNEEIRKSLADADNGMLKTSLSASLFKYEALLTDERYADAVLSEIETVWGGMLFSGAKTLWETRFGADDFGHAGSLCHAWSAVPVYILYRYYVGFYPKKPGFSEYTLSPVKSKLSIKADLLIPGKTL